MNIIYEKDKDGQVYAVIESGGNTQHIYNGSNIVADVCGDNTQLYIRGNSLHFNKTLGTSDKQTYIFSPKGDVSKLINADGTYEHFEYIPYGEISEGELQANNPFGYCGEYTDAESGLIYLRNRYYNPELGSFITEDPIKDGLNLYAYCSGNPINFVDPLGTFYIKKNSDGTYTAYKSPFYANFGKVVASVVPYGDYFLYTIENFFNITGGTSKTNESSVLGGSMQSSLLSKEVIDLFGNAGKFISKGSNILTGYQACATIYDLGTTKTVDNISFDLMQEANIPTTASNQEQIESNFEKTAMFIAMNNDYFNQKFRYGTNISKTFYEIDYDLSSAITTKELNKKINTYIATYKFMLKQNSKPMFIWPKTINNMVSSFRTHLEGYATRRATLISQYKDFMEG